MAEAKKVLKKTAEKTKTTTKKTVTKTVAKPKVNKPVATDEAVKPEVVINKTPKVVAKAGKRSSKALKEAEEKVGKQERKATSTNQESTESKKPTLPLKPVRSKIDRASKKMRVAAEKIEKGKEYSLGESLQLAVQTSTTSFDGTVELHINLRVDPRQADQNIRGSLVLPAGTGKIVKIAVFAEEDEAAAAKKAGADIVGIEDISTMLDKQQIDFNILIATPAMMPRLGKYARLLGPRGMMPNPKSGTVATDVTKAVTEARAGRVEYRVDTNGIVHLGIGKVSFGPEKLGQNAEVVLSAIKASKPSSVKGSFIKSIYITTTMGPSIRLNTAEI